MAKVFYCSECGVALEVRNRAIKGDVVRVVAQHVCVERGEGWDLVEGLDTSQDMVAVDGEFVRKLDDLSPEKAPRVPGWPQDERPEPEDLRNVTTTAPAGVVNQVPATVSESGGSPDPREVGDEPGDGGNEG